MKFTRWLIIGVFSMVAAGAMQSALGSERGPYWKLDVGPNFLRDVSIEFAGDSATGSFETGYRLDLACGYELNEWAAVELETGFLYNSVEASDRSWMGQAPLLANFVVRFENRSPFVPYAGIGAGGALSVLHARILTSRALLIADNATAAVFAYQAMAGVAWKLNEVMDIDLGYKFLGTTDQSYDVENFPSDLKVKDVQNHFVGVSFTWKF